MKVLLVTIALFAVCTSARAQDCEYDVNKTDPFTGKPQKIINCKLAKSWKLGLSKANDAYTLSLLVLLPGQQSATISAGDSLIMKTAAGDLIVLYAKGTFGPSAFMAGASGRRQVYSSYIPDYSIEPRKLMQMTQSPIVAMRVFLGATPVTLDELKERHTERIRQAAYCILQ